MMFGLFSDEGLVEGDFMTEQDAYDAIADRYDEEDELEVLEVCHDHEDQPSHCCEECYSEEEA